MAHPPQIIVLGRIGMDLYPANRAKIAEAELLKPSLGGSSGNIAAGLSRLGAKVEMLSLISDDPVGHYVEAQCKAYGIGTRFLGKAPGGTNTNLALAENRLDDFDVVIYRNNAADLRLNIEQVDAVDFNEFNALILTGTALSAEPSRSASVEAMRRAPLSVLDLDYRPAAWRSENEARDAFKEAAQNADIVIGNDDEFAVFGGGEAAANELGLTKLVIYKMGAKGAKVFSPQHNFEVPIFKVDALKPVGAGDAFMAGFMMAYCEGRSLHRAVLEGAANAALVVTREACAAAMPNRAELDSFLKERGA